MNVFTTTLSRMAFLFSLIVLGYLLVKLKVLDVSAAGVLSRLENALFIPALVMGTFLQNFTMDRLTSAWVLLVAGFIVCGISIIPAIIGAKMCTKDEYLRRIYTYGLSFSNFGFMGNAVVSVLFPDIFAEYLIFTLPFWVLIFIWGVPSLLIDSDGEKPSLAQSLKKLINPMIICMFIGMIVGISGIRYPAWIGSLVTDTGACMSPIAMLLTGITVAKIDLRTTLRNASIYAVTFIRLVVFPAITLALLFFLKLPETIEICTVCALSMPLGLNTVVIPAGYGKDTTVAAGMAMISHVLSCITIPVVFLLLPYVL